MKTPTFCSYAYPETVYQTVEYEYRGDLEWVAYPDYFRAADKCQFCNNMLEEVDYKNQPVLVCWNCGWWHFGAEMIRGISPYSTSYYYFGRGVAKYYEVSSLEAPLDDLRKYLAKHPYHVAHTHYTRFEQLMADCLKSAYGDGQVKHVGGVGDRGIDLILVTSRGDRYLVQIKRRQLLDRKEGVQAVRELNGVLFRESQIKGMLISTAAGFTKGAIREVEDVMKNQSAYEMVLVDLPGVVELLNLPKLDPYEPWVDVFDEILSKHR